MRAVVALVVLAGTACGADAPATFSEIYPEIFPTSTKAQCDFCHGLPPNNTSNGSLSFGSDATTAYAALMAMSVSSMCGSGSARQIVVPGDADASLLMQKLEPLPPCGGRMPLGGTPLTADELAQVRSWIEAGAAND